MVSSIVTKVPAAKPAWMVTPSAPLEAEPTSPPPPPPPVDPSVGVGATVGAAVGM